MKPDKLSRAGCSLCPQNPSVDTKTHVGKGLIACPRKIRVNEGCVVIKTIDRQRAEVQPFMVLWILKPSTVLSVFEREYENENENESEKNTIRR